MKTKDYLNDKIDELLHLYQPDYFKFLMMQDFTKTSLNRAQTINASWPTGSSYIWSSIPGDQSGISIGTTQDNLAFQEMFISDLANGDTIRFSITYIKA